MEKEPVALKALSTEAALQAHLEARMDASFNALENQFAVAIAKMTETIPAIITQHIAESLRSVR